MDIANIIKFIPSFFSPINYSKNLATVIFRKNKFLEKNVLFFPLPGFSPVKEKNSWRSSKILETNFETFF